MEENNIKKKIVSLFLDNSMFLSPETIKEIEKLNLNEFYNFILNKKEEINKIPPSDTIQNFYTEANQKKAEQPKKNQDDCAVHIIKSHKGESRKRTIQDFISLFNDRYNYLSSILQARQELKNPISIRRLKEKTNSETVCFIGMVSETRKTKSGHVMLKLEDPSGTINVLANKNRADIFESGQDTTVDEVIGVIGKNGDKIVFANKIILPDIPLQKVKKCEDDVYAIFLGDFHFGSNLFCQKEFDKFLEWISGKSGSESQKEIAKKIKYIFLVGDLVAGVGIYPNQEKGLKIKDLKEQYLKFTEYLKKIPSNIKIIISTGNHDPAHIAEPQPAPYIEFARPLYDLPNVLMVGNPAIVNIHKKENFPGFDVLLYHGFSYDYFIANIDRIRTNGGYDRADLIMKYVLQRRHLAPSYGSTQYLPTKEDHLLIKNIPDFFVSGHLHRCCISSYKNVTMICASCWEGASDFQIKQGHNPEPARVPIANLKTRKMKILKF